MMNHGSVTGMPSGYTCATCGAWVQYGTTHMCGGHPGLSNIPGGTLNLPPCRATWNPLNAEMIRLIIREELERHFATAGNPEANAK